MSKAFDSKTIHKHTQTIGSFPAAPGLCMKLHIDLFQFSRKPGGFLKTAYMTINLAVIQDLIRMSQLRLGCTISHQDVLFHMRTFYFLLEHPIRYQNILFCISRSCFILGCLLRITTPYSHQDTRKSCSQQDLLFQIRTSYFTLGRRHCTKNKVFQ